MPDTGNGGKSIAKRNFARLGRSPSTRVELLTAPPIPRNLAAVALAVVSLHVSSVVFLGTQPLGSLFGNILQIFCSSLAAAMCFRSARRAAGFSQSFWLLVGVGMGMWGVADLGWTYSEVVRHAEPAPGSIVRFLFDTHGMFFVMAIFLNQEKEDAKVDLEEALDFIQIGILFFFIYFGMYFLPAANLGPHAALGRELTVVFLGDIGIILLSLLQWWRGRLSQVRSLYGGLALYIAIYSMFSMAAEFFQVSREEPTGTWFDLAWSLPLLYGAYWAATWQPIEKTTARIQVRNKSLTELLINNGMFILTPLLILFQVAQLGPGWKLIRFSLLGVSFACYAMRIGLTQFRRQKDEETVRRQTLAMDSSVDGIAILNEKGVHIYSNEAFARMLGFDGAKSIVGKPWRIVHAFQEMDRLEPEIRRSLAQARRWSASVLLRRPDGSKLPADLTITAMPDGGTACVCRDLSENKQAEKAREEAETKYRMLVEHVNAIAYIAEIGIQGQWFYVSPQVESILGYTPDEWLPISHNWASLIHSNDVATVMAAEEASKSGVALPSRVSYQAQRWTRSLAE